MLLAALPVDLLGVCFSHLDDKSLLILENLCRGTRTVVETQRLWKQLFENCAESWGWSVPSYSPPAGWKRQYFIYLWESRVLCIDRRNRISARFLWCAESH